MKTMGFLEAQYGVSCTHALHLIGTCLALVKVTHRYSRSFLCCEDILYTIAIALHGR